MKKILISICLVAIAAGTVSAANYKGDINRDGKVDLADMAVVAAAINSGNSDKTLHDINGSGVVDDADLDALADIILSEKLTEDTGLNIGIGGWGDGGEFGGVVTSPGMSRSVESTQFFLDGPKYDFDRNSSYMEFGIEGTPSAVSGILFNITVPEELDFEAGKFVELYEQGTGHRLYGKPVVTNAGNDRRIRFIVFSNTLEELPTERTVLGRIYPLADVDNYFGHSFINCQTIARGATRSVTVPEHGAYVNWSFGPVTGITLNETSVEMQVDGEMTLYATILPDNAKNRDLRWSSDNTNVATVDSYGTIRGVSVGEATVTVTAADGSGVSATCHVKVNPVLVSSIELDVTETELIIGETYQLNVSVSPDNATDDSVEWSCDNPTVATVDGNGVITALSVGEATVTVTAADGSGVSATCRVKVNPVLVSSIELDVTETELIIGETYQLNVSVSPDNATDNSVEWSCDNPAVATVDGNGVITALSVGEATVTVTAADGSGVSATCRVKVNPVLVSSIELDVNDISLRPGGVRKLIATVMPDNATDKKVVWKSENEAVASVDESGNVTAVSQGEAIITATSVDGSGAKAECVVRVLPPLATSIVLDRSEIEMTIGDKATLTARMEPANAETFGFVWSSANETVAKVADGVITAIGIGETTITVCSVHDATLASYCHVKVNPVLVSSIELDVTEKELIIGETYQLNASVSPDNATDNSVEWSCDSPAVATVDGNGVITALSVGEATVTVTAADGSGVSASCRVKVNPVLVSSIELDVTETELIIGDTYQLNVSVSPDNATDNSVEWSCDSPAVATVDGNGVITALSVGEATVTVTAADGSGVSASCRVKVNPVLVSSIELDVNDISLRPGGVRKLIATVMPDNATDKRVVWSSENEGVALVDESGNVTAVSQGEAILTVTSADGSGAKAECVVRVLPPLATSIVLDRSEIEMNIGDAETLTAMMEPANAEMPVLVWSSSDESVATVVSGVVTATGIGEATITVSSADDATLAASCRVKVNPVLVSSIELDVTSVELTVGESVMLHVTVLPENATDKRVSWSSDDIAAAIVDDEGKVTITGAGSTVIRVATLDGSNLEATCMVLGLSGLMEVIDDSAPVDIYSMTGILVGASVPAERTRMLEPGTYIIRQCGSVYKVVIR